MAAQDFLTAIYDKIWALLEAHGPWTALVKPGNRTRFSGDKMNPVKTNRMDADLIEATLWPAVIDEDSMFLATENYGHKVAFNVSTQSWRERITASFALELITPDLKIKTAHAVILESLTALRKGGPTLGLSYVRSWGPVTMDKRPAEQLEPISGTRRMVSMINIPVTMHWQGSSLIT